MATHIFVDGQSFGPGNRFAAGETRRLAVTVPATGSVGFKAGRNGSVLAGKVWQTDPDQTGRIPVVIFDEGNQLLVTTGLR